MFDAGRVLRHELLGMGRQGLEEDTVETLKIAVLAPGDGVATVTDVNRAPAPAHKRCFI